jgi:hypothetical protein
MIRAMGARVCVLGCALLASAQAWAGPTLPAPKLSTGTRTFVAFAGQPAPVALAWTPVPGAAKYRATWTSGADVISAEVTETTFQRSEKVAGPHVLTVTAIDAAGVESPPSDLAIDVVTIDAFAPGARGVPTPAPVSAFAIGSKFSSPGLRCQLGPSDVALEVVAKVAGAYRLRCGGENGQPMVEVPVVIAPVIITADLAPIARDTQTRIHLTVASVGAIGEYIEVAAIGDLDLGPAERVAGGLDIPVTPGVDAVSAGLIIRASSIELGRVAIDLVDPPAPYVAPAPESDWAGVDLGVHAGAFLAPDVGSGANAIGHPIDPDDVISGGPVFGLRFGLFPTRRVGIEIESEVATSSYANRLGVAAIMINRAQLAARLVEEGRFGLRGIVGGDLITTLNEAGTSKVGTLGGLHYGAAFSIETRPGVSVRVEALHVITVAQDAGYAHCLELQIGVVTRLGRRDRWK